LRSEEDPDDVKRLAITLCVLVMCGIAGADDGHVENKKAGLSDWLDISGLFYLTYENGTVDDESYSQFFIRRAYLTFEADILPFLSGRITFDTAQDLEGQGRGDMEVRLKYAFAKFHWNDVGILNDPNLEVGIVHMVWLDFEEHIDLYRMRGPMFMERSGIFNSADFGVTFASGLGADMDEAFRSYAGNKYGTRNGSLAIGLYNGSGYHGDERNTNKTVEARLTWRPFPGRVKGLQLAGLVISGQGNQEENASPAPDWETYNLFAAYQFDRGTVTAQVVSGSGNQRGTWFEPDDPSAAMDYSGWSVFGELRLGSRDQWRLVGAFDDFERVADNGQDHSFVYGYLAFGYDFGRENILLIDLSRRDWADPLRDTDDQVQLVMQLKF
jgi:hypothetical protein